MSVLVCSRLFSSVKQAHLCLLSAFAIVFILTVNSSAQFNYADFSNLNPNDLSFVQAASVQGNKLRLINGLGDSRGAVWTNTTQPVKNGFVTMFSFQITNPQSIPEIPPAERQNGADGFAFVIHTWGTGALGNGGGQIGYASDLDNDPLGIPYSLAIEFDTYYNPQLNDPDGNHISVHNYGQYYNSADENITSIARVNSNALGINLKDGNVHNVRIEYDGTTMKIFVDDFTTPKLTFAVNFNNIFIGGENNGTIGFTAGAAAESNYHEILNWSFVRAYVNPCGSFGDAPESSCQITAPDADTPNTPNLPGAAQMPDYHPGADPVTGYNTTAKIDTAVLPDRATEHWAKYYFPKNIASVNNLPLVVLLHGQHNTCGYYVSGTTPPRIDDSPQYSISGNCPAGSPIVVPNHKGYDYLATKLASWGYIVASVNSNRGINNSAFRYSYNPNFPDYQTDKHLIRARGRLVLRHLQRLSEWNEGTTQGVKSVDQFGANRQDFTGWVGMKITTGALPLKIKALGRMYRHGNSQTHTVKIVKVSGNTQVANVSIPMTNWNEGQFKYVNLPPTPAVTLAANTAYYIISQETTGGDVWSGADSTTVDAATITPTDAFTVNGKVKSPNGTTTWNNVAGSTNQTFGPVDFIYEVPDAPQIKSETLGTLRNNITGWVGMKFTTGAFAVKVKSLGRMFRTGNTQSHAMRLVRVDDNTLIASATVTAGGTNNKYKYVNLPSPVTLTPNTAYYLVSQETTGGDQFSDSNTTVVPSGAGTINGRVFSLNGTTIWDTSGAVANQIFGPVNFIYEAGSTPTELGISLKGKIDFGNVGLMGHSRGGEGVRAAYNLLRATTNNPWQNASSGRIRSTVNVKGIFEIAPTDRYIENPFDPTAATVNADGTAWATLLPACDGDLFYLPGVKVFDRMLPLTGENPAKMKATFYVYGTNHNFYNSEWQTTDSPGCIGNENAGWFGADSTSTAAPSPTNVERAEKLRKTGSASFMAFFRGNVGTSPNTSFNRLFNPAFKIPTNISSFTKVERGYTASPNSAQTTVFNSLRHGVELLDVCSSSNIFCSTNSNTTMQVGGIRVQRNTRAYFGAGFTNHDDNFMASRIYWYAPSPTTYFQANWAGSGASVDATGFRTLDFRISRTRNESPAEPRTNNSLNIAESTNFSIQLIMADGKFSKNVPLADYITLKNPVGVADTSNQISEIHPILQTVRINLTDFTDADLTQIKAVRFIFNDTPKGAVFLSDIQLSK